MGISKKMASLAVGALTLFSVSVSAQELKTEDEKTLYALGLSIGQSVGVFGLSKEELEVVKRGLTDQVNGVKPKVDLQAQGPKIGELARTRAAKKADAEKAKSSGFLAKAEKEKGAVKTASGLIYVPTKAGTGAAPTAADTVKVHYKGTLMDGTEFDSSFKRNEPATFPLNGVIKCWTEGLQKMKVGGKAKLYCPSDIAYGDRGQGALIPPGATLTFEVELLEIVKK